MTAAKTPAEVLEIDGFEVRITSPDRVVFAEPGLTKLDIAKYYVAVADGALRGAGGRPMVLKRFVKGIVEEAFFQKRVPDAHPEFIDTATLHYARGTSAEETVVREAAGLAWIAAVSTPDTSLGQLVVPFMMTGAGMALVFPTAAASVLASVRPENAGKASGATNAIREIGGVMGVAVLASVFAANGSYASPQAFTDGVTAAIPVAVVVLAVGAVLALFTGPRSPANEEIKLPAGAGVQAG